jgi:nicotinate-nucleotide adenylyltransferase
MKRLGLDRVWWLVTPGNPLKDPSGLASIEKRLDAAHRIARHPRIDVTGLEAVIHTRYTIDTIKWLVKRTRGLRLVWIMGADNLKNFHRWRHWRQIATLIPIAIVDRGGLDRGRGLGLALGSMVRWRVPQSAAQTLPNRRPPAWVLLHGIKLPLSSTALRKLTIGTSDG